MKKRYAVLLIILVAVAALCFWQRNNIEALFIFATNDSESTEHLIEENKEKLSKELEKYSDAVPRALTAEEEEKIASGEMSISDAVKMLLDETEEKSEEVSPSGTKSDKNAETEAKTETPASSTTGQTVVKRNDTKNNKEKENTIIKRYTAELYSMKAYYIGQLSQIEGRARSEFSAMTPAEKKNLSKAAFVGKYAGYATSLLGECDSRVNSLLANMKSELSEVGGDMSIIPTIRQAYESEKAARKAYYLNMVS